MMSNGKCQNKIKKMHLFLSYLLVVLTASCSQLPTKEYSQQPTKENNATAIIKPVFEPLAPGNIQPSGWLRDWAVSAIDGFVGHLDEYEAPVVDIYEAPADSIEDNHFGLAWNEEEIPYDAVGSDDDGTGWPLEQCAYWLDGALRLGYVLNDTALINKIERRLDIVVDGVNEGGDTFIYWLEGQSEDEFNGWAHSHMGRALVAYYRQTQKPEILNALEKVYSKYMATGALDEYVTNLCNVDPMVETLAFTGNENILNNVLRAMNNVSPVVDSWAEGDDHFSGHTVVMYENIRLPMPLYPWTGDKRYLD